MAAKRKRAQLRKAPRPVAKRVRKTSRKAKPAAKRKTAARKAATSKPQALPPRVQVLQLLGGYWVSQLLFVAVKLGIADRLAKGPLNAEVLAERVGADARHLYRLLRALASVGVFAEDRQGRFKLTKLAQMLRSDAKGSLYDFALMIVDDYNREAWGGLEYSVKTGRVAFDEVHKVPVFEYLKARPEKDREFSASMASISAGQNETIAAAYPFGRLSTIVDVGGAHGHLLASILRLNKKLKGVLYDQPQVVAAAAESGFVTVRGIAARCRTEGGDFFQSVPEGADGYLMKHIIHDWDDERCIKILENCRNAMAKTGKVLLVEAVIPKGNGPHFGKLLDINMMVIPGGQERTKEEFAALFARAGLRLNRIVPTTTPVSVLEAVRA
jgi:O-methyltransferase domain/Dimerisation domain